MADDLERLLVQIEANTRGYDRSMERILRSSNSNARRIERRFDGMNQQLGRSFQAMTRVGVASLGALGVAVGGVQMGRLVSGSLAAAEAIADTADRVGFATDKLQELRFSADQNGSSVRALDMGLQRFSRRVAEAAMGAGELEGDLTNLGIPLRDQNGQLRESYDILLDYADAIRAAGNDNEQLRLAFKAFDSEGATLVNLLRQGRDGVQEWGAAARDAGLVLEDGLVRQGAEANAVLRQMRQEVGTGAQAEILKYTDELIALSEAFAEIAKWAIRAAAALPEFGQALGDSLYGLSGVTSETDPREAAEAWGRVMERIRAIRSEGFGITDGAVENAMREEGISRVQRDSFMGAWGGGETTLPLGMGYLTDAAADRIEAAIARAVLQNMARRGPPAGGGGAGSGIPVPRLNPRRRRSPGDTRDDSEDVSNAAPPLESPVWVGGRGEGGMRSPMPSESGIGVSIVEEMSDELMRQRDSFAREFAFSIAGGLRAAADGDGVEFFASRLEDATYRRLSDALTRLGEMFFDWISGLEGGGGFKGLMASGANFLFGGGKAAGGPVDGGKMYRVGERGPEMFVPTRPGMIVPNDLLRANRLGRGGGVIERERVVVVSVDKSQYFDTAVDQRASGSARRVGVAVYGRAVDDAPAKASRDQRLKGSV